MAIFKVTAYILLDLKINETAPNFFFPRLQKIDSTI